MSADYEYGFNRGYEAGYRAARERSDLELQQLRAQVELLVKHAAHVSALQTQPRVIVLEQK